MTQTKQNITSHKLLMKEKADLIIRLNAQLAIGDIDGAKDTSAKLKEIHKMELTIKK